MAIVVETFRSTIRARQDLSLGKLTLRQQPAFHQRSSIVSAVDRQRSSAMGSVFPSLVWLTRIATYRSTEDRCTVVSSRRPIDAKRAATMGNNWRVFANKRFIVAVRHDSSGAQYTNPRRNRLMASCASLHGFWCCSVFSRATIRHISDRRKLTVSV